MKLNEIDVLILCGGIGQRLAKLVKDRPKPMVEINGKPFLDYLLEYLKENSFKRIIMGTGYMSEKIKEYYSYKEPGVEVVFSGESKPLGTAGAVRNAQWAINSNPFLVMNGDSFCRVNFADFLDFHLKKKSVASIVLCKKKPAGDFGSVKMNKTDRIDNYKEKMSSVKEGFVNAGVYLFDKKIMNRIPENKKFSLEYQVFPKLKKLYGYIIKDDFIDIGNPERLKMANNILPRML